MTDKDTIMERLFSPTSIAVIGASRQPGKLGHAVLNNLVESGFKGPIYPVNPQGDEILGLPCYPQLDAIEGQVDLAVVVTPARGVLQVLEECGRKGVQAAVVMSAGFRETGHEGLLAEHQMKELADRCQMGIVGPNCLGVIDTYTPMNVSFAAGMPLKGHLAFMSQSGALCTAVLDMSFSIGVGFSRFVSLGNKAHLGEIDFMEAWESDPESRVVLAYLEGVADGARFMEVARRLTKKKPMVAIKSGSTSAGSRAVSSHTGTLAGSERAYEAAFRQSGVLRAGSVAELFDFAVALSSQPLPQNNRVAVVTNAGGPGIMATDALERSGLTLASLMPDTMNELIKVLPAAASVINPVDVLGDALADRYHAALGRVITDPNVDAMIVMLTPQIMTEARETALEVVEASQKASKPVLACFMGDMSIRAGVEVLTENGIPNYPVPERAVGVLKAMVEQTFWQRRPLPDIRRFEVDGEGVSRTIRTARQNRQLEVGEFEARSVLESYGIPIPVSRLCTTAKDAVKAAEEIGYPVVMKIASPEILHKTDIGGVRLDIRDAGAVRDSFDLLTLRAERYMPDANILGCLVQKQVGGGTEVIIGMNRDPQFGPLVMFGIGGIYVEVLKDVSFRIAPFSQKDAMEMISEIRSADLLYGVRGQEGSDIRAIADTLLRVSQLVTDFPEIVEMDINPLVVFTEGQGVMGVDMRMVLEA
jgi:acetyl coenzyme A synthetase (ADP forming)-like protein